MPCPAASACTFLDSFFSDGSLKHVTIYVSTDVSIGAYNFIFRRELMRAMPTDHLSLRSELYPIIHFSNFCSSS